MIEIKKHRKLKSHEMKSTLQIIEKIVRDDDPLVRYRNIRPVTDIKYMLETSIQRFGLRDAFKIKERNEKTYHPILYKNFSDDVSALGTFLIYNGLKGKNIAIMGEDSYEWAVSYLSVVCGTGVVVPLDHEWTLHELKRYLNATDCSCIIFSATLEDVVWELYNDSVTPLQTFIRMRGKKSESQFILMEEAISEGEGYIASGNREFFNAQITPDDLAVIQFAPETADIPKPVMLSHKNIVAFLMSLTSIVHIDEHDVFFSTLPMSNSLKSICGLLLPLYKGSSITFHEGPRNIKEILRDTGTTILIETPVILKNLYNNTREKEGECGFDPLRVVLCGDNEGKSGILQKFRNLGVFAAQAYVLPECSSIAALNLGCNYAGGFVGRILPGTEVRIADADPETGIGEICLKGPIVTTGYYNKSDYDTPRYPPIIKDGWYCTNHAGTMDENNDIYVLG